MLGAVGTFNRRRSDSYVEDKMDQRNNADGVQRSLPTTVDPPLVVVIKPPLR